MNWKRDHPPGDEFDNCIVQILEQTRRQSQCNEHAPHPDTVDELVRIDHAMSITFTAIQASDRGEALLRISVAASPAGLAQASLLK